MYMRHIPCLTCVTYPAIASLTRVTSICPALPACRSPDTAKPKRARMVRASTRKRHALHCEFQLEHQHNNTQDTMVNERPRQFGGVSRFGGPIRPGAAHPSSSATAAASPGQSRATQLGLGLGKGSGGLGKGKGQGLKRHM
jgi:hypothetical protein